MGEGATLSLLKEIQTSQAEDGLIGSEERDLPKIFNENFSNADDIIKLLFKSEQELLENYDLLRENPSSLRDQAIRQDAHYRALSLSMSQRDKNGENTQTLEYLDKTARDFETNPRDPLPHLAKNSHWTLEYPFSDESLKMSLTSKIVVEKTLELAKKMRISKESVRKHFLGDNSELIEDFSERLISSLRKNKEEQSELDQLTIFAGMLAHHLYKVSVKQSGRLDKKMKQNPEMFGSYAELLNLVDENKDPDNKRIFVADFSMFRAERQLLED